MKYCLSSRQIREYLKKADEIKIEYRDRDIFTDLLINYPKAQAYILQIAFWDNVNWEDVEGYSKMAPDKFICCVSRREDADICRGRNIKFYYGYPIKTYQELRFWLKKGVCYVRLGAPLFFDLPTVKKVTKSVPIRAIPNIAYDDGDMTEDFVIGTWMRPEDQKDYERFISTLEFEDCDIRKEEALFRIYAEKAEWPGAINMIVSNFDESEALNRLLPENFGTTRMTCRQTCQSTGKCNYCKQAIQLSRRVESFKLFSEYLASKKKTD